MNNVFITAVEKPVEDNNNRDSTELEKLTEVLKASSPTSPTYSSKTFPKISPSRKIQNINIVFPTVTQSSNVPDKSENDRVTTNTDCLDKSTMSVDSLDFTPQRMSTLENDTKESTSSTPIKTSAVRSLSFQKIAKTPRMSCPPPAVPTRPPNTSFREGFNASGQIYSTPKKFADTEKILISPVAKSTNPVVLTPKRMSINRMNCPAPPAPVTPAKTYGRDFLERSSTDGNPFLTPKKSTEMQNIIKNQQKRSPGKSFVEEIIQELNSKCSPRVKTNCVTPTSRNFVKKLVKALEMGCVPKPEDEDKTYGSCSDVESKSGRSSATASIKDSDSGSGSGSDSEQKSSSSRTSTFRSFSRALENRDKISREDVIPYVDDEDESVYWIPLPTCKLPRTSSLINMMSRLTSQGSRPSSIPSNPGSATFGDLGSSSQPTNFKTTGGSGWGRTFDKRQSRSRQLFRIDETTVLDSGYSDRSGTNSSSSSVIDETWYEDNETTQTASEFGDDSENVCSSSRRPQQRAIPEHRQRTFVV